MRETVDIAADNLGQLFVIVRPVSADNPHQILLLDKNTLKLKPIANLDIDRFSRTCIDFEPTDGTLYMVSDENFGTIDLTGGGGFTEIPIEWNLRMFFNGTPAGIALRPIGNTRLNPEHFQINKGWYANGYLQFLDASNDQDYSVRRDPRSVDGVVELETWIVSPLANPSALRFMLESSAFYRNGLNQSIEFYDNDLGDYVLMDSRPASQFVDSTVNIEAAGQLAKYVNSENGRIRVRLKYSSTNPRQSFSVNIDHCSWLIRP